MRNHSSFSRCKPAAFLAATVLTGGTLSFASQNARADDQNSPETVLVTLHVKPGREAELEKILTEAWAVYRRLHLVLEQTPHLLLRSMEKDKAPCFIEVLTWTSHDVPDHAPAEVRALWERMQSLCETLDGHPAIEIPEVRVVSGN